MTDDPEWQPMSPEEKKMVNAIVSASGVRGADALIDELSGAVVSRSPVWVFDVKPMNDGPGIDIPNGPFPVHAYVPSAAAYQGEIIIWIKDGHLDGLEYVWVSDTPPTRWPRPDEMEVVPDQKL